MSEFLYVHSYFANASLIDGYLPDASALKDKRQAKKGRSLHDFRRAFALAMLRNGADVYTLAKLMGHEGITVLLRYLKQTYQDT
jgi:site-specific recombinase XerD